MLTTNFVTITGYVGNPPEKRYYPDGTAYVRLSVATTKRWKDKKSDEPKEHTEWHKVVVRGPTADYVAQYVKKGSAVQVLGSLHTRNWTDKDGVDRSVTEIRGNLDLLDRKPSDKVTPEAPPANDPPTEAKAVFDDLDDDIPY